MLKVASETDKEGLAEHTLFRHESLKRKIYNAENESDVRQSFLALYDLDLVGNLEKYRIDYVSPDLWLEFKYSIDLSDRRVRCRVLSQILHYLHYAPTKRGELILPETFGIVDKTNIILYDTCKFLAYIINPHYFKDIKSPSQSHPDLEKALFSDPIITSDLMHVLSDYDQVWNEFEKRGVYDN